MATIQGANSAAAHVFAATNQIGGIPVNGLATTLVDQFGNPITSSDYGVMPNYGGMMVSGNSNGVAKVIRADMTGGQASSSHVPAFVDQYEGTTANILRWNQVATTMTVTQSNASGMFLNAAATLSANTGAMVQSLRQLSIFGRHPMSIRNRAAFSANSGSTVEIGVGDATTMNGAHTNAAMWLATGQAVVTPVLISNSATLWTGVAITSLSAGKPYLFEIIKDDNFLVFLIIEQQTNTVVDKQVCQIPSAAGDFFMRSGMPLHYRVFNGASAITAPAPYIKVYDTVVTMPDVAGLFNAGDAMAMSGRTSKLDPFTGARISSLTPNTEQGPLSLSASTALPGFLDGRFQFNNLAANAQEYPIFGYSVPKNSTLVIKGVTLDLSAFGTAAPAACTHTWNVWTNCIGGAVTGAKSGFNLGNVSFGTGSLVGDNRRIAKTLSTPEMVYGGTSIFICVRIVAGAGVASSSFLGNIDVDGYFI